MQTDTGSQLDWAGPQKPPLPPDRTERIEQKVDLILRVLETILSRMPEDEEHVDEVEAKDLDGRPAGGERDQTQSLDAPPGPPKEGPYLAIDPLGLCL